jgi:hypothetical protein
MPRTKRLGDTYDNQQDKVDPVPKAVRILHIVHDVGPALERNDLKYDRKINKTVTPAPPVASPKILPPTPARYCQRRWCPGMDCRLIVCNLCNTGSN